jgi:FMN-dependent NADH-azoreductase
MRDMSTSQEILDEVTAAYRAALSGKTVKFNGREITTHDLPMLRKEMTHWQSVVASETGGGFKPYQVQM